MVALFSASFLVFTLFNVINNEIVYIYFIFLSSFSEMALVNIMLLAGLGLDLDALKKMFGVIMRLTLIPTILEVGAITLCSHYLLNFPWLWGVLLGWVLVVNIISYYERITVLFAVCLFFCHHTAHNTTQSHFKPRKQHR